MKDANRKIVAIAIFVSKRLDLEVMALVIIVVVMVAAPPWIRLTGDDVDDRQR